MLLGILLTIHIIVCVALIAVILLQRSEGGAFGMGGGGGGFMTARGAGDLLTRTTAVLAGLFFLLSLVLTILSGRNHATDSVTSRMNVDKLDLSKPIAPPPSNTGPLQAPAPQIGGPPPAAPTSPAAPLTGAAPIQPAPVRH